LRTVPQALSEQQKTTRANQTQWKTIAETLRLGEVRTAWRLLSRLKKILIEQ
jgi:hypothetical protein